MESGRNKERQNQKRNVQERCNGQTNHHVCQPETPFMVWSCRDKRQHECCKGSNNDEGGRKRPRGRPTLRVRCDMKEHQFGAHLGHKREARRFGGRKTIMAIDPGQG